MQAFILSDLHPDTWFSYANKPSALRGDDVKEDVVISTMEYLWKLFDYPDTDAIVLAGDVSNDWLTYTRAVKWLSNKYKEVYMCVSETTTYLFVAVLRQGLTCSSKHLKKRLPQYRISATRWEMSIYSKDGYLTTWLAAWACATSM